MQDIKIVVAGARVGKNHLDTLVNIDPVSVGNRMVIPKVVGLARKDRSKWNTFADGLSERCTMFLGSDSFRYSEDAFALFEDSKAAIAVIATPSSDHYQLGLFALENGMHVMIEKPLTTVEEEGYDLIELARAKNLMLDIGTQLRCEASDIELTVRQYKPESIEIVYQLPDRERNEQIYFNIFPHIISMFSGAIIPDSINVKAGGKQQEVVFAINYGERDIPVTAHLAYVTTKNERRFIFNGADLTREFLSGKFIDTNGKAVYNEVRLMGNQEHHYPNPRGQLWEAFLKGVFDSDYRAERLKAVAYEHEVLMKGISK